MTADRTGSAALATAALDYALPEGSIATRPAEPRDAARLMVVRRSSDAVEHVRVRDLPTFLEAGDRLVFNDTAVAPARLRGRRAETGGVVDGLFLAARADGTWSAMLTKAKRLHAGSIVELIDAHGAATGDAIEVVGRDGAAFVVRPRPATGTADAMLDRAGATPLPPYILKAREQRGDLVDDDRDRAWYQTVYADASARGSVAAPTAGLHFTPDLLEALAARGVARSFVTLHVGPGTFRPVSAETLDDHEMHTEWWSVPEPTIAALRAPRDGRLVAVGTTTVRTLESLPAELPATGGASGETELLIAPGYAFRHVDALLTNFHLPRSTLLALVAALLGLDRLLALYEEAIGRGYRFYSYGDAMLILP